MVSDYAYLFLHHKRCRDLPCVIYEEVKEKMEKIIEMLFSDYEGLLKPRLSLDFMPVNRAESTGMLFERIGDIALTVICVLESNEENSTVMHLPKDLPDIIGVSKETLMKDALENMGKVASPVLTDLRRYFENSPLLVWEMNRIFLIV